ncbi:MAG: transcriptional regulator [Thermodesulfovibrionales bacterium]
MKRRERDIESPERLDTVRHQIVSALRGRTLSARDISQEVRIAEREVYDHLEHIRKSLSRKDRALVVVPARCRKCGFEFRKRERLKAPGKCPVCRGESIEDPLFSVVELP